MNKKEIYSKINEMIEKIEDALNLKIYKEISFSNERKYKIADNFYIKAVYNEDETINLILKTPNELYTFFPKNEKNLLKKLEYIKNKTINIYRNLEKIKEKYKITLELEKFLKNKTNECFKNNKNFNIYYNTIEKKYIQVQINLISNLRGNSTISFIMNKNGNFKNIKLESENMKGYYELTKFINEDFKIFIRDSLKEFKEKQKYKINQSIEQKLN